MRLFYSTNRMVAHGDPNEVREELVDLSGGRLINLPLTDAPSVPKYNGKK